jgi:hypothetical protein
MEEWREKMQVLRLAAVLESAIDADALPTHVRVNVLERDTLRDSDGDLLVVSAQAVLRAMSRIPGKEEAVHAAADSQPASPISAPALAGRENHAETAPKAPRGPDAASPPMT